MNRLVEQARALIALISDADESKDFVGVSRAVGLIAELIACGEWRLAIELSDVALLSSEGDLTLELTLHKVDCLTRFGEFAECFRLLDVVDSQLLASPAGATGLGASSKLLRARVLWRTLRLEEAKAVLLPLRSELLSRPDSVALGWCSLVLANVAWSEGKMADAGRYATEAMASAFRNRDIRLELLSYRTSGILKRLACHWLEARADFQRAAELAYQIGHHAQFADSQRSIAIVDWKRGRLSTAAELTTQSVRKLAASGAEWAGWFSRELLAMIEIHAGEFEAARVSMRGVVPGASKSMDDRASLLASEIQGDIELESGQAGAALGFYDVALTRALALAPRGDIVAELRRRRAECFHLLGRHDEAYAEAMLGLQHTRELGDRYEEAATYRIAALAAAALNRPQEAKQLFEQGFALFEDIETPYEWGKLWMAFGDWLSSDRSGSDHDPRMAVEAYHAAHYRFETMGAKAKLAEVNARIARAVPAPAGIATHDAAAAPRATRVPPRPRPARTRESDLRIEWALERFGVITANPAMFEILGVVEKLAKSRTSVLVLGESGTGKELVAHALHRLSGRTGEFVAINCATLPKDVIESELFGHVAGAFTGAAREKAGLLEVCEGGTVFLDEISEMPYELQSRLLRFLESGEIRRVGATRVKKISTRVVAASNREDSDLRTGKGFREDLYFRLAQPSLKLPALRLRGARDIELLAEHFLARHCEEEQKSMTLSDAALQKLARYAWPGNIRELRSTMSQRAVLNADGDEIQPEDLRLESDPNATPGTLQEELDLTERRRIEEALRMSRNSKADAARLLGIPRTTLLNRMAKLGIETA